MSTIQIIDVSDITLAAAPSAASLLAAGRRIVAAFRLSGFAYLRGHGVPARLREDTFAAARAFFALDEPTKRRFERFARAGYNGYTPVGGENTGRLRAAADLVDLKECYDLHVLGENYPDDVLPIFSQQLELMGRACCQLSSRLLAALQAALTSDQQPTAADQQLKIGDQAPSAQDDQRSRGDNQLTNGKQPVTSQGQLTAGHRRMLRKGGCSALRVLNYPPVPESVSAGAVRCASHTDYGTLTLLFQDDLGGLELETTDGQWMPAAPVPDTVLVNVGDLMEVWSSGRLRATRHRVVVPHQETLRRRARQSIALFVEPDDDVMARPLDGDPRFAPVNAGEALRRKFAATYPAFAARYLAEQ